MAYETDREETNSAGPLFRGSSDLPGQVLSVELGNDEEVIWQWTHRPDGTSVVTGYEIVKNTEEKSERSEK
jgi:hypothetical protein